MSQLQNTFSSRGASTIPAPSSRYDAGSSEQVFCTWLIREWNFAYLHHIHTRESPSEYSEGRYWSTLMYVVLKFLSCLQFQYQTAGIRKLLVRWCGLNIPILKNFSSVGEYEVFISKKKFYPKGRNCPSHFTCPPTIMSKLTLLECQQCHLIGIIWNMNIKCWT